MPVQQGEGIITADVQHQPVTDLLKEYHDRVVSLFGQTGPIGELVELCPLDHSTMALETKNMIAGMALNESGSAVKQEHVPLIRELVESRGAEVKITVQEPSLPEQISVKSDEQSERNFIFPDENKFSYSNQKLPQETVTPQDQIEEAIAGTKTEIFIDDTTTLQMDEWLREVHKEYEIRKHELQEVAASTSQNETKLETFLAAATELRHTNKTRQPAETKVGDQPVIPHEKIVKLETIPTPESTSFETEQGEALFTFSPVDNELIDEAVGEEHTLMTIPSEVGELNDVSLEAAMETDEPEAFVENEKLPAAELAIKRTSMVAASKEVPIEDLLHISELIPNVVKNSTVLQPESILDQIADYIEMDEELDESTAEITSNLIAEIGAIAEQLVVFDNAVESIQTEDIVEIEIQLRQLCEELFDKLGIERDDELLQKFMLTIIKEKMAEVSSREIEYMYDVLHERKNFSLQGFVVSLQAKLPSFLLLGRYALATQSV